MLSSDRRAASIGIRTLLGLRDTAPIPPCEIRMGTTLATNALLERRGVRLARWSSRAAFGDLLEIGDQTRPRSVRRSQIDEPEPLYARVVEVEPARGPMATCLRASLREVLRAAPARSCRQQGITSLAVVVLARLRERASSSARSATLARAAGLRARRALPRGRAQTGPARARGATTVLDAYLTPLLASYLALLARAARARRLRLMQSSGGLTRRAAFRGPSAVLSGPAGGVVACAEDRCAQAGFGQAIGFDMGGTSTDVSRYARRVRARLRDGEIAGRARARPDAGHPHRGRGRRLDLPLRRRSAFASGPESAGADPGPLCYGKRRRASS